MGPKQFLFILVICSAQFSVIQGLRCYFCVQSGTSGDRRCEKDPASLPNSSLNCNKKYCVIRRIEYIDQEGAVFSFYRGCEQKPDFINSEITDSQYKTYYRSCTTGLCNSGDGRQGSGGGNGGINSGGDDDLSAILVPGIGSYASKFGASLSFMAVSVILVIFRNYNY